MEPTEVAKLMVSSSPLKATEPVTAPVKLRVSYFSNEVAISAFAAFIAIRPLKSLV